LTGATGVAEADGAAEALAEVTGAAVSTAGAEALALGATEALAEASADKLSLEPLQPIDVKQHNITVNIFFI